MIKLCAMNGHYRFYELEDFFKHIKSIGFDTAEIWTGPQHFFMDYQGYESVKKLQHLEEKYQIKIAVICPEQTNPKPNNMATKDLELQKHVYKYFTNAIDVAASIQAKMVLVTSGWAFLNEDIEDAFNRSVHMMKRLCEYAQSKRIYLAMESLQHDESLIVNSIDGLKRYKEAVNSNQLKVCIDFGAMAGAKETIEDYFKAFKDDIVHVHFVDGAPTGHLAWGDGERNMSEDIKELQKYGYDGLLSLESVNGQYYEKPYEADLKTMQQFNKIMKENEQ
ncbi:protein FrlC [Breznakia sp. PF5-3]|uniref:sugar phosphate isomerase/epimerase family protein n=1 Tax=unclassified Breznakia TaxID=2623764 RepID=UPI002404F43F|nr:MULTISPECIES: sugar phosphate isomerase/epimerase family protein [unclassified Breznakia]MDL2276238.1 sugar phosphate isomerase/epimerase [Breznakia sp. OttesenSCG-928-G09]MDF9824896.1 protein FrlC [Breznakia sp. PM6-1]MDF9835605.1 protein FrlC [Breznakia sp. PF5-3]MDF9837979.1 protein FrlC [Breznakia sp. PFB2-8]MDF9859968.1 protein FrlC [Breznakia sp. PH5-24]